MFTVQLSRSAMTSMRLHALSASAALLCTAPLHADVLTVDSNFGATADFVMIGDAINAAQDGDLILVKPGGYISFSHSGKSLAIVADNGEVGINYTTELGGLAPGQNLLLQGLRFGSTELPLVVGGSAGSVWLRDCEVLGQSFVPTSVSPALIANGCEALILSDCTVSGNDFEDGRDGINSLNSTLYLYDSFVDGGTEDILVDGDDGLHAVGSEVHAMNTQFAGGPGGGGLELGPGNCIDAGDGGDGVEFAGAASTGVFVNCAAYPGLEGYGEGSCPDGVPGTSTLIAASSTLTEIALSGPARSAALTGLLRNGEVGTLSFQGAGGELLFLVFGGPPDPFVSGQALGAVIPSGPLTIVPFGALPPSGDLSIDFVACLPPGLDMLRIDMQPLFASLADGLILGTPLASFLIGPGF